MTFISLDIETTSLNKEKGKILELGMIKFDINEDAKELNIINKLRLVFIGSFYADCSAIALNMNANLIKEIAEIELEIKNNTPLRKENTCYIPNEGVSNHNLLCNTIKTFIGNEKVTFVGKNLANFDIPYIKNTLNIDLYKYSSHRVLDISPMFFKLGDKEPPSLKECLLRSNIEKEVDHTSLKDALDVIKCIANKFNLTIKGE